MQRIAVIESAFGPVAPNIRQLFLHHHVQQREWMGKMSAALLAVDDVIRLRGGEVARGTLAHGIAVFGDRGITFDSALESFWSRGVNDANTGPNRVLNLTNMSVATPAAQESR